MLTRELKEARDQRSATTEVLRIINSQPGSLAPVFDAILQKAHALCGADDGSLQIYDGEHVRAVAVHGVTERFAKLLRDGLSAFKSPAARASFEGQRYIQINDARQTSHTILRAAAELTGTRTILYMPLRMEGRLLGFIAAARREVKPFTENEIGLLENFAAQAVVAMENARLFNETQEALERQTATGDILKVIASSPSDVQPVFAAIAERSNRLLGGLSTAVYSLIEGMQHLMAFTRTSPAADAALQSMFPRSLSGTLWSEAVNNGQIFQIADAEVELAAHPAQLELARVRGWQSALLVPLLRGREPIGLISVTRAGHGGFADRHVQLLKTFAAQAVIAIENARLFNNTREALERQTATADILKVIASSPTDVQPVFDAIAESARRLLASHTAVVTRVIDDVIHLAASTAESEAPAHAAQGLLPYPLSSDRIHARVARTGQLAANTDAPNSDLPPHIKEFARELGWRSMLVVPMLRNGIAIGTIGITRREAGAFDDKTVGLLKTFADQAVIAIENARLFNETQQALERQTATSEVLQVISSSPGDLKPVFERMLAKAMHLCEAQCGFIYQMDQGAMRAVAEIGVPPAFAEYRRNHLHTGGAATPADVMRATRKPAHVHDARDSEPYRTGNPNAVAGVDLGGARTVLYVPMIKNDDIVGVINVYRQEVRPFTNEQISLLENFASQAVIAIENARLFNETKEALERQTATSDVLKVIASSPSNLQPVFDAIAKRSNELMNGHATTVFRFLGETAELAAFTSISPDADAVLRAAFPRPLSSLRDFDKVSRGQIAETVDATADTEPETDRNIARARGFRGRLVVPLKSDSGIIGAISITRTQPGPFARQDVELLCTFADQAVIAIQNVELFQEVQSRTRDLQESLHQQTATADVLKVIASSPTEVVPVLQAIVESACGLCESDDATVALKDGPDLVFKAQHGSIPVVWDRIPINRQMVTGRAMIDGQSVHVCDLYGPEGEGFSDAREFARQTDVRTVLSVPLLREGESIGVITLRRTEVQPFSDKQTALLQTFADQAVIAISNVRLFEDVQQRTRELSKSLDDLRTAQDRLIQTEKLASLGQLTAGIAHEIKNPLNFVNNFSAVSVELTQELNDVLRRAELVETIRRETDELTGMLKDNLSKIVQHGKRANSIVKNMLLHSRQGSREQRAADINTLVEESLNLAYHGARAEKADFQITLQRDLDANAGMVEVFPQEVSRALLNLISNGFYAATKRKNENGGADMEPTVLATTRNLGSSVEIRIRDNGTGIPPEIREKIFNPFFTTKPTGEGTGLGLSMTHDIIVKQHGGRIDIDSKVGEFTEFIITLPRSNRTAALFV